MLQGSPGNGWALTVFGHLPCRLGSESRRKERGSYEDKGLLEVFLLIGWHLDKNLLTFATGMVRHT